MKELRYGARVLVRAAMAGVDEVTFVEPMAGVVRRPRRCDDGAWVQLDAMLADAEAAAQPFRDNDPSDDRRTHVLTYPEFCDER